MKNNIDLVSVIIRTKDRPNFLKRAIDSVCSQDYKNIEIIIINDGGCEVVDIINHYKSAFENIPGCEVNRSFEYVKNAVSVMRTNAANIGLQLARGKFICLLDDDDYFYSQHLSKHINVQKKNDCLWSVSRALESIENEKGVEKFKKYNYSSNFNQIKFYFFENYFPSNSIVFQRKLVDKIGLFDKNLEVLEDWDFWIRMYMESKPCLIEEVTCVYTTRNGASNVRMANDSKQLWKDTFIKVMDKYKSIYNLEKVNVPLKEIDNFLSKHAVEWYKLVKENEELRDSYAYKIFYCKRYHILKKIGRFLGITRG